MKTKTDYSKWILLLLFMTAFASCGKDGDSESHELPKEPTIEISGISGVQTFTDWGQQKSFTLRTENTSTVSATSPEGWTVAVNSSAVSVTAPVATATEAQHNGTITLVATGAGGKTASAQLQVAIDPDIVGISLSVQGLDPNVWEVFHPLEIEARHYTLNAKNAVSIAIGSGMAEDLEGWEISLVGNVLSVKKPDLDQNDISHCSMGGVISLTATHASGQTARTTIPVRITGYMINLAQNQFSSSNVCYATEQKELPYYVVGEICLEYVRTEDDKQRGIQSAVAYGGVRNANGGWERNNQGIVLANGGTVHADGSDYLPGTVQPASSFYIIQAKDQSMSGFIPHNGTRALLALRNGTEEEKALFDAACGHVGSRLCSDHEGNTYGVVKIGSQYWSRENFRAATFRDGTSIAKMTSAQWYNNNQSAQPVPAYYEYDTGNVNYGYFYNSAVVTSAAGIAPNGFRVPERSDYEALSRFLGGTGLTSQQTAGVATLLKSVTYRGMSCGGNNLSGFTANPGWKDKGYNASFEATGFWTLSADPSGSLYQIMMNRQTDFIWEDTRDYGLAIRFIAE